MNAHVSLNDAKALMAEALVWDNHACMPLRPHDLDFLPQLERCRRTGIHAVTLNVGFGEQTVEEHFRMLATFRAWLAARPDDYLLVDKVEDLARAKAQGKLAVLFDIEGMNAIADQLSLVQLYYDLGVRWMLIAYNRPTRAGGGCVEDTGLTDFGRQVIDEMARVGMVLCCSHTGHETARAAIAYSKKPVIFSHSNPSGAFPHIRNIPDDLMRMCADKGGVVGINGIGPFLGENDNSTAAILRHLDYALRLIGEDHVGLGLDYVYDAEEMNEYLRTMKHTFPPEMQFPGDEMMMVEPERIPEITKGLLELGYAPSVVRKVLGENIVRVAREVWK